MPFSEVIGQEPAIGQLRRFYRSGRVPHALLFLGPEGTGRRLTATRMFQAFACERRVTGRGPADDACSECNSCHRIALHVSGAEGAGSYPDLHLLEPEGKGTMERIRNVIRSLSMRTFAGGAKGLIIDPADGLKDEYANILLKTIEEPPPETLIILVGESRSQILPTILSRCIPVRFRPIDDGLVERRLMEKPPAGTDVTAEQAQWAAALAQGSLGRAFRLLDGEFPRLAALAHDAVEEEVIRKSDLGDWSSRIAAEFKGNRQVFLEWLDLLILIHRSALGAGTKGGMLPGGLGKDAGRLMDTYEPDDLADRIGSLLAVRKAIDGAAHLEMSIDKLMIELRE